MVPNQNLIMYTDDAPQPFTEVKDEDIGNVQELVFRGKESSIAFCLSFISAFLEKSDTLSYAE
jgi:hypothetical protein